MAIIPYKGKTTVDSAAYYCPYIPITIVRMDIKIKFKFKDIGEKRWMCTAEVPRGLATEFEAWVKEFLPNTWLNKAMWRPAVGNAWTRLTKVYELRGTDYGDQTMLIMKWGR